MAQTLEIDTYEAVAAILESTARRLSGKMDH